MPEKNPLSVIPMESVLEIPSQFFYDFPNELPKSFSNKFPKIKRKIFGNYWSSCWWNYQIYLRQTKKF